MVQDALGGNARGLAHVDADKGGQAFYIALVTRRAQGEAPVKPLEDRLGFADILGYRCCCHSVYKRDYIRKNVVGYSAFLEARSFKEGRAVKWCECQRSSTATAFLEASE